MVNLYTVEISTDVQPFGLGMDKKFHPTHYNERNYLSIAKNKVKTCE